MKKNIRTIIFSVLAILIICMSTSFWSYNAPQQNILLIQLGEIVDVKTEPGIFLKLPVIQSLKKIYVGERLYDVPKSEVITSDKKTMIANCYVTWQIVDAKKYYQTLSSDTVAQSRIDTAVYNSLKNVIGSSTQDLLVSEKDSSIGTDILNNIDLSQYGIIISEIEIKVLDLPEANKEAVYTRMIAERDAIAAEYKANGEKEYQNIKSETDSLVRQYVSDAEVIAADIKAEGEKEYFQILSNSYGASPEKTDFYNFIVGLEAMKESLSNGGTIAIDENSPLYNILNNN